MVSETNSKPTEYNVIDISAPPSNFNHGNIKFVLKSEEEFYSDTESSKEKHKSENPNSGIVEETFELPEYEELDEDSTKGGIKVSTSNIELAREIQNGTTSRIMRERLDYSDMSDLKENNLQLMGSILRGYQLQWLESFVYVTERARRHNRGLVYEADIMYFTFPDEKKEILKSILTESERDFGKPDNNNFYDHVINCHNIFCQSHSFVKEKGRKNKTYEEGWLFGKDEVEEIWNICLSYDEKFESISLMLGEMDRNPVSALVNPNNVLLTEAYSSMYVVSKKRKMNREDMLKVMTVSKPDFVCIDNEKKRVIISDTKTGNQFEPLKKLSPEKFAQQVLIYLNAAHIYSQKVFSTSNPKLLQSQALGRESVGHDSFYHWRDKVNLLGGRLPFEVVALPYASSYPDSTELYYRNPDPKERISEGTVINVTPTNINKGAFHLLNTLDVLYSNREQYNDLRTNDPMKDFFVMPTLSTREKVYTQKSLTGIYY